MSAYERAGAGESGKSTVLKQMRVLYGSGFGEVERLTYKPIIHSNMITAMQQLIAACTELGIVVRDTEAAESVDAIPSNSALSPANVGFFSRLWRDEGIQVRSRTSRRPHPYPGACVAMLLEAVLMLTCVARIPWLT
ncbi:hypothetical protein EON66_03575 [archaeon]|nr:MAG: hypothetical protein EON66_03575 [archaeon]